MIVEVLFTLASGASAEQAAPSVDVRREVAHALTQVDGMRQSHYLFLESLRALPAEETIRELVATIRANSHVRTAYVFLSALGGASQPAGYGTLLAGLRSPDRTVRYAAAQGLLHAPANRGREITEALLTTLAREGVPENRQCELHSLSRVGQPVTEERAAVVLDLFGRESAARGERSAAASAMIRLLGVPRSLEAFQAPTKDAAWAGILALLTLQGDGEGEGVEWDPGVRRFAIGQLAGEDAETRLHAISLSLRFIDESPTSGARAANLELRSAWLARLPHETDEQIAKGLSTYVALVDDAGYVVRPQLPTGVQP